MNTDEINIIYDYLHKNYLYLDGQLIRKKNNKIINGSLSGNCKKLLFCVSFRVNNIKYNWSYGHLIYLFHHKHKPKYVINVNNNHADNRIENLQEVDHSTMMKKCDLIVNNKHGYKGVVQDNKRFGARLWIGKKYKYISWHDTPEEAHAAYLKAKEEHKNG